MTALESDLPLLVGVGGFLGAGKTTTILRAAAALRATGRRVAVVTNDQASGLVDTATARAALDEGAVAEIAGGCFCCRFDDLVGALRNVIDRARPDVILAEAVGSCTDLAATVYQPLRQHGFAPVRLGPLSVVVDGERLRTFARLARLPSLPTAVGYLYERQLAEADVLLLNKTDLLAPGEAQDLRVYLTRGHEGVPVLPVSARTGAGLDAWLDTLVAPATSDPAARSGSTPAAPAAGDRVLDLDYDRYAAAEAALGWLNLAGSVGFPETGPPRAAEWTRALLASLAERATSAGTEVAHVKVRLEAAGGACGGNLVSRSREPSVWLEGQPVGQAALTLNARIATAPETLRTWVEEAMRHAGRAAGLRDADARVTAEQAFAPARPVPTFRLTPV